MNRQLEIALKLQRMELDHWVLLQRRMESTYTIDIILGTKPIIVFCQSMF